MVKRKYELDETVFDNVTRDSAYWIGYLYGDGNCTCENKIRLALAEYDTGLIYSFRDFIHCINKPIKHFIFNDKEYSRFEIRSWRMHNTLKQFELTKRKELRKFIHPSLTQEAVVADFVRGIFDADGTFYYDGLHKNWLYSEITGYMPLMKVLKSVLVSANVIDEGKKIVGNHKIFRIRLAKDDTLKLIRWLYKDCPKYYLKRKYGLAKNYLDRLNNTEQEAKQQSKMYLRPRSEYNIGKKSEHVCRKSFKEPTKLPKSKLEETEDV